MKQTQDLMKDLPRTMNVPTFRENSLNEEAGIFKNEQEDAFLLYSDDEVRMRVLSGGTREAPRQSTATDGVTRKTRISFELHPSALLEYFLPDDPVSNGVEERVPEGAVVEAAGENPKAKVESATSILASILSGRDLQADTRTSRAA
eukprot:scaffold5047_cov127-Skeletonema_menzelii.AAC.10